MTIDRVGVIGGGLMGSGIAEVCAKAGSDVVIHEVSAELAEAALGRIETSLGRAIDRGKLDEEERSDILSRINVSTDLSDQANRQLLIEAATENEKLKLGIFSGLDSVVTDPDAILASNTSSIPITRLASATNRPASVIGLHFFNPVPVMPLVEMITTDQSSKETETRAFEYVESLGKTVVHAKDRPGFIVNALLVPYLLSAIRMLDDGVATREDIDVAMRLGANHPMGPLELTDFVGLDTTKYIADVLYEEFGEPQYAAPPLLIRMVEEGLHGRKTGKGFYNY